MSNYEFKILNAEDDIVKLRLKAFNSAYGQRVNLEGLKWNATDSRSNHLGIYVDNSLVSCLRLSVFNDAETFINSSLLSPGEHSSPPFVLLSRAATDPQYSGHGFHSILRVRALEICQQFKLYNVFGSLEKNATRLNCLLQLGYEVVNRNHRWPNSYIESSGEVVLIRLSEEDRLKEATEKLRQKYDLTPLELMPEVIRYV